MNSLAGQLASWVGAALLAYVALLAALWWTQERLVFLPAPLPPEHRFGFGADVHEVWIDVPGARLHGLHLKNPHPRGFVFYLHGNAGNLAGWFQGAEFWRAQQVDLFMLDYRGYGKSTGHIASEAELQADVRAAWDAVAPAYDGKRRVILGRSLGSALAAQLAIDIQPEMTVLVSPYESLQALARQHYPWVPTGLLRYALRTDEAVARMSTPLLLMHGAADDIIDAGHSERLLQRNPRARRILVPGAGHNDLDAFDAYRAALAAAAVGVVGN